MVITLLVPVRKAFGLEGVIRDVHFDNMGKFVVLTSTIVAYAYGVEFFMAWYSANPFEQMSFWHRAFGDYWWATWIMIICNVVIPLPLWIKRVRLHVPTMWVISIFINIGMWFERFVIITTGLSHEYEPAAWGYYVPAWPEITILIGRAFRDHHDGALPRVRARRLGLLRARLARDHDPDRKLRLVPDVLPDLHPLLPRRGDRRG
jgi:molybdopterin-containing oxidoreductase family membrane subunit